MTRKEELPVLDEVAVPSSEEDTATGVTDLTDGEEGTLYFASVEDMKVKACFRERQVKRVKSDRGSTIAGRRSHSDAGRS